MRRRRGIWILGLLPTTFVAAAVSVHASSAAPTRATTGASTIDVKYSCRVSSEQNVSLFATVTLPPVKHQPPGLLNLTTGAKTATNSGTTVTVAQLSFSAKKNSLRIDKSSCRRVQKRSR